MTGVEIVYRKPRSAQTIAQYFEEYIRLQVEENCTGPFDILGGNQGSFFFEI
jgi:hypothetical protein